MKKDVVEKWVTALRSGDYRQGRGALATRTDESGYRFCCLGVLSDLAAREGVCDTWERPDEILFSDEEHEWEGSLLPNTVQKWAGMRSPRGSFLGGGHPLADLNDGEVQSWEEGLPVWMNGRTPHNFSEIADIIEERWGEL